MPAVALAGPSPYSYVALTIYLNTAIEVIWNPLERLRRSWVFLNNGNSIGGQIIFYLKAAPTVLICCRYIWQQHNFETSRTTDLSVYKRDLYNKWADVFSVNVNDKFCRCMFEPYFRSTNFIPNMCDISQGWSNVRFSDRFPLISNDIPRIETVFNSLITHHLIKITRISYETMFTISLQKLINIAPLKTCVICVTASIRHCDTDYSGLKWCNINTCWY